MPLEGLKEGDKIPLTLTEKVTDVTHFITKLQKLVEKPRATKTA
jgi:hypothetical protein